MIGEEFDGVLLAAREGAHWAIGALYNSFQPRLLRYLQGRIPWEAEDIAHEVWLDAAGAIRRFEGDENAFAAWLFTIARRRVVDQQRKAARRPASALPVEELHERPATQDVESEVVGGLAMEELLARIRELPADQADVIMMRVVGGLDVDEVAKALGKRPGTVRVIAHRALKRLAKDFPELVETKPPASDVTDDETQRFQGRDAS